MALDPNMHWYFQELLRRTAYLSEQLNELAGRVSRLEEELRSLQNRSSTHIDKIEYSFEQLKVETLAGTLVIGMAGGLDGSVEEFTLGSETKQDLQLGAVGPQGLQTLSSDLFVRARQGVRDYLGVEIDGDLELAAGECGQEVDEELKRAIKEDLGRQSDGRIAAYLKQLQTKEGYDPELEKQIVEKVKADIRAGLKVYFDNQGKEATT